MQHKYLFAQIFKNLALTKEEHKKEKKHLTLDHSFQSSSTPGSFRQSCSPKWPFRGCESELGRRTDEKDGSQFQSDTPCPRILQKYHEFSIEDNKSA